MSTVIARRIVATPIRTSSEAWAVITQLLAPGADCSARAVLERASGVACSAIASEAFKGDAAVVYGNGPRVRCYCLYDDDAVSGEDTDERALPETPTEGDWRLSIPVPEEDFEWSARAIKACAPHITVRKVGDDLPDEESTAANGRASVRVNLDRFLKP